MNMNPTPYYRNKRMLFLKICHQGTSKKSQNIFPYYDTSHQYSAHGPSFTKALRPHGIKPPPSMQQNWFMNNVLFITFLSLTKQFPTPPQFRQHRQKTSPQMSKEKNACIYRWTSSGLPYVSSFPASHRNPKWIRRLITSSGTRNIGEKGLPHSKVTFFFAADWVHTVARQRRRWSSSSTESRADITRKDSITSLIRSLLRCVAQQPAPLLVTSDKLYGINLFLSTYCC